MLTVNMKVNKAKKTTALLLSIFCIFTVNGCRNPANTTGQGEDAALEEAAIQKLRQKGWIISKEQDGSGAGFLTAELMCLALEDESIRWLPQLKKLRCLELIGNRITDEDLIKLEKIKSIEELHLDAPRITDAGLKELERMNNLRVVRLYRDTYGLLPPSYGLFRNLPPIQRGVITKQRLQLLGVQFSLCRNHMCFMITERLTFFLRRLRITKTCWT